MGIKNVDSIVKAFTVMFGVAFIGSVVFFTMPRTQSSFLHFTQSGSDVFLDKYAGAQRTAELKAGLGQATRGALEALGIKTHAGDEPRAYFAAHQHYGVVNPADRLVRRKLTGVPSSDFMLLRNISLSMFANELAADTISSRDGQYVFMTVDGDWRRAALHGYAHALAARNMPRAINDVLGSDARFDAETWYRFRFVDEAIALFVTDAHKLLAEKGSLAAALDAYPDATAAAYRDPSAPMYVREQIVRLTTFSEAPKTASLYVAANAFSSFLLRSLGQERSIAMAQTFLTGEYRDLDELFSFWGGFERAMEAWKGDPAAPRSGVEALMQLGLAPAEQRS